LPIRFIYASLLLAFLFVLSNRDGVRALSAARSVLILIGYLGFVGFFLGSFQGGAGESASLLIANHVQAVVLLLVSMIGTMLLGQRAMTIALALAVALSLFVSLLQSAGFQPASDIRNYLGTFYFQKESDANLMDGRFPGLSYSSIVIANQACLTFALLTYGAFNNFGRPERPYGRAAAATRRWLMIGLWSAILFAVSLVQGNRSPILGLAAFACLVVSARRPALLMLAVPILAGLYYSIDPIREMMSGAGYRVAETGDKSEMARSPLLIYGWRLFLNNPWGYGLTFDSKILSQTVQTGDLAAQLSAARLSGIFEDRDLHNYWVTILNIYGIFIAPVLLFVIAVIIRFWLITLMFLPYFVHITFHNAAPLNGDYMFWVAIGIVMAGEARTLSRGAANAVGEEDGPASQNERPAVSSGPPYDTRPELGRSRAEPKLGKPY
jgi:hypothetical protein